MKMDLLIQKIHACCSKEFIIHFKTFLQSNHHQLSYQLICCLNEKPDESIEYYCSEIYGNSKPDAIKKLNQLSHHTLKLFAFITRNYPSFLHANLLEIESLLFQNQLDAAIEKIKITFEVSQKLEDFSFLYHLSNMVRQNEYLTNTVQFKLKEPADYLKVLLQIENIFSVQQKLIQQNIDTKYTPSKKELEFFKSYFHSDAKSIQIIAKQSYLNVLSSCNHELFYSEAILTLIQDTIKETEKYAYLIISKYKEKLMSLDYMLVKHNRLVLNEKEINKTCSSIINKWTNQYHNDSMIDKGLMLALSIKGSYLITHYYFHTIPLKLQKELKTIIDLCQNIYNNNNWDRENFLIYINFCNVFSIYFILLDEPEKAIKLIERILHEYQQKSFKKLYDGLFVILIMAYFRNQQYEMVIRSFNRYKKLSKTASIEENDLVIKALYYLAQYKDKNKVLYLNKLDAVVKQLAKNELLKDNFKLIERIKQSIL